MLALSVYAFCVQYVYDSMRSWKRQQLGGADKPPLSFPLFRSGGVFLLLGTRKTRHSSLVGNAWLLVKDVANFVELRDILS